MMEIRRLLSSPVGDARRSIRSRLGVLRDRAAVRSMRRETDYEDSWTHKPLVSVRIATYNRAEILVERALASVRRQTYTNWEAIVVGDACTDDTGERIAALNDDRIRFENLSVRGPYPTDENKRWLVAGAYPANRALELVRGAWIAPIDDDDAWDDDHIEVLLARALETKAEFVYGPWRTLDVITQRMVAGQFGGAYPPVDGAIGFQTALYHAGLRGFRYEVACEIPGDRALGLRLYKARVRFAVVDRPLVTYWFRPQAPQSWIYRKRIIAEHGYLA